MGNFYLAFQPSLLGLSMRLKKKPTPAFKVELGYNFPGTTQKQNFKYWPAKPLLNLEDEIVGTNNQPCLIFEKKKILRIYIRNVKACLSTSLLLHLKKS